MATLLALAPVIAGVLGLGGTAYLWWSNRKASQNTPVMRENAVSARDQQTLEAGDQDLSSTDDTKFEKDITR